MARGRWGHSPHIKGSRKLAERNAMGHGGEPGADPTPRYTCNEACPKGFACCVTSREHANHLCDLQDCCNGVPTWNGLDDRDSVEVERDTMLKVLVAIVRSADHNGSPGWHEIEAARALIADLQSRIEAAS